MQSVAIVLAGNFEIEQPTQRQAAALMETINRLHVKYRIPRENIIGHKEASPDACPGKNLTALLERIKSRL